MNASQKAKSEQYLYLFEIVLNKNLHMLLNTYNMAETKIENCKALIKVS